MKEALKNTVIELYKSGIAENIHLADNIIDNQKHIPFRQLKAIDEAISSGRAWISRHSWKFLARRHQRELKSYDKSKASLKYINK